MLCIALFTVFFLSSAYAVTFPTNAAGGNCYRCDGVQCAEDTSIPCPSEAPCSCENVGLFEDASQCNTFCGEANFQTCYRCNEDPNNAQCFVNQHFCGSLAVTCPACSTYGEYNTEGACYAGTCDSDTTQCWGCNEDPFNPQCVVQQEVTCFNFDSSCGCDAGQFPTGAECDIGSDCDTVPKTCYTCDPTSVTCQSEEVGQCYIGLASDHECFACDESQGQFSSATTCASNCYEQGCFACDESTHTCVNNPIFCDHSGCEHACLDYEDQAVCELNCEEEITIHCWACTSPDGLTAATCEQQDFTCFESSPDCNCAHYGLSDSAAQCRAAGCFVDDLSCHSCWRNIETCQVESTVTCVPFFNDCEEILVCPEGQEADLELCTINCKRLPKQDPKRLFGSAGYSHRLHGNYMVSGHSGTYLNLASQYGPDGGGVGQPVLDIEFDRTDLSPEQKAAYCTTPVSEGWGDKAQVRYFWDPFFKQCRHFTYRGNGGNINRFLSKNACDSACGFLQFEKVSLASPFYDKFERRA